MPAQPTAMAITTQRSFPAPTMCGQYQRLRSVYSSQGDVGACAPYDPAMAAFEPLPGGVTWRSAPLFNFVAERSTLEAVFGPVHALNLDSNGVGLFDAWALRFPCGLEVCLWSFHDRPSIEVHANSPQEQHIRFHLGFPLIDVTYWTPSRLEPEPLGWRLLRQDDNGNVAEVARYPSRCEAIGAADAYTAKGHKQLYWVETLVESGASADGAQSSGRATVD